MSVTIRFPRALHADLTRLAAEDERSLTVYVVRALREHVDGEHVDSAPSGKKGGGR